MKKIVIIACSFILWSHNAFSQHYTFDKSLFNDSTYKYLVVNNYLPKDTAAKLTEQNISGLQEYFYYTIALEETNKLNHLWLDYYYKKLGASYNAKSVYYSNNRELVNIKKDRLGYVDTIKGKRYVLMTAWKSPGYFQFVDTPRRGRVYVKTFDVFFQNALFVTQTAQLHDWIRNNSTTFTCNSDTATLPAYRTRFMQLLGLPPASQNNIFFDFWVCEDDLFRPALDSSFNFDYIPYRLDDKYLDAFIGYSKNSFTNGNVLYRYPFSGLGYTWDWNPGNSSHIGLSEFVVKESRIVYVERALATQTYVNAVLGR